VASRRGRGGSKLGATDALVARLHDFGETSAVAVLLTADRGSVHVLAKGAKRARNSFLGPLDKGVLYRVRLGRRAGEGLGTLHSASAREAFPRLRTDAARFHASALVLEVASDLMREDEPGADLFRLSVFTLKALYRAPPGRIPRSLVLFLARALALSGHAPETSVCVACGRTLDGVERPLLSPVRGGALHAACAHGEPGARTVPAPLLALLRSLLDRPPAQALRLESDARSLRDLRRLLVEWFEHALERRFRAAPAVDAEFSSAPRAAGYDRSAAC